MNMQFRCDRKPIVVHRMKTKSVTLCGRTVSIMPTERCAWEPTTAPANCVSCAKTVLGQRKVGK